MSIRNSRCPGGDSLTDDFATALAFLNLDANPTLSQQVLLRKHDETFHFDHLPSELISQIICCAIQAWGDQYNQDDRFIDTNPFHLATLRRVCQRWNQVALQTPELWRGLELDLDKLKSGHDFLGFANAWFDRAGERAPLRLTVAMEGAPSRDISSRTSVSKQLLSLMLRGGRNWEKLQLYGFSLTLLLRYGNNWFVPESLAPASKSELFKFPTLKTLSLQASCDYPMITPAMCCFGLFAAPNPMPGLKSLYIRSNTAGPGSFAFYPQNLRFLHLHGTMYFSPHNFAKFPALEEITFEFASLPSHLLEGPMGPLLLPSLRRLAIIEPVSVSLIEVILTTFRTPALQLLRFSGRNQWVQLLAEHCVERFFKESNATDLTLSLEDSGLSCAHVRLLLSRITPGTIQHLHLDNVADLIDPSPIYHLHPLLYSLKTIVFRNFSFRRFPLEFLLSNSLRPRRESSQSTLVIYGPAMGWESAKESQVVSGVVLRRLNPVRMGVRLDCKLEGHKLNGIYC